MREDIIEILEKIGHLATKIDSMFDLLKGVDTIFVDDTSVQIAIGITSDLYDELIDEVSKIEKVIEDGCEK